MRQNRVTYNLVTILLSLTILSGVITAQENQDKEKGTLEVLKALTERSQSQQMLDLMVGQSQNRFLDDYVDPAEYIVGPGDGFVIYFLASGITNIECQINSDGRLFVKSVGAIEIGHVNLARATELIRQAVSENYERAEFTVQLTGFRFAKVNILGEVKRPGIYYVPATWRISEVISLAGGLTNKASMRKITLSGFDNSVNVDLVRYYSLAEISANPMICRGNILMVPTTGTGAEKITVSGEVMATSSYEYMPGDNIEDYIKFAGGIKGYIEDVQILIYSNEAAGDRKGQETVLDGASDNLSEQKIQAGYNINICLKPDRKTPTEVMIFGAVNRPGRYTLGNSERTLDHLFERSGGITDKGSLATVQIFRIAQTISHNGSEDIYANGKIENYDPSVTRRLMSLNPRRAVDFDKIDLNDGDSIFVPKATGIVTVNGAVAYPGLIAFQPNKKVEYYIRAAGGYTGDADKAGVIVINNYSGGRIDAKFAETMFDGEIIIVPRKETGSKR